MKISMQISMRSYAKASARFGLTLYRTVLLMLTAGSAIASSISSDLFPDISAKDFPSSAYSATLRRVQASPQSILADSFHARAAGAGFAAKLRSTLTRQALTGKRTLSVQRFDDGCVNAARKTSIRPELECGELSVEAITPDVLKLVYRHRYFDYQLQMTMVQTPMGSGNWQLLKNNRRGEPQNLRLSLRRSGTDALQVVWHLDNKRALEAIDLNLSATITPSEFRQSGFNDVELGLLAGADFFYDSAQIYAPDWAVYAFGEIIDTPAPSPDDNDPHECKVVSACSAEYQSCTPTQGGWYVCEFTEGTHIDWGGGFGNDPIGNPGGGGGGGGGGVPPAKLPDWVIGSRLSLPKRYIPPYFNGLFLDNSITPTRYLHYQITSVLNFADVAPKVDPKYARPVVHRLNALLIEDATGALAYPECGEGRADQTSAFVVLAGDEETYIAPGRIDDRPCSQPKKNGVYVLQYVLDPNNAWAERSAGEGSAGEGSTGESNNIGFFDGFYFVNDN